jgi:hypothetical protein
MSTTNENIANTINRYLDDAFDFTMTTRNQVVEAAFTQIQSDRQRFCLNNATITSAEHYLFARYIVGGNFILIWPVCAVAFPGYDVIKGILGDRIAATQCPVSSYDWHHTLWKEWGCKAGSFDYWSANELPLQAVSASPKLFGRGNA